MNGVRDLGGLIRLRAGKDGDRTFLVEPDSGETLSFGGLEEKVRALGSRLAAWGFKKGDRAACMVRNGIRGSAAFLAVTAAGGVAVPVSPRSAPRELAFLLEHSGAAWLLAETDGDIEQKSGAHFLEEPEPGLGLYRIENAGEKNGERIPADLALLLYTSGTTGIPKGVMLTHANLLAECNNIRLAHNLTREDKALCLLPLNHINGLVVTLLTPLYTGFPVVMPPKFSAGHFWSWVQNEAVTWFSAVPTIYSILLSREIPSPAAYPKLRFMRSASSALPEAVLAAFEEQTGVPLIESYGITEGGSQITSNPLPPGARKPGSVGLPFGDEIRIIREEGGEAPLGTIGEVAVRGKNIACAYYKNEEATRESFRDGWFLTGDLGYFDTDGYLYLQGRRKELINRAGEMISPREIDELLYRIPGIELAAAVGVPHPLYGEEIVAFIKLRGDLSPSTLSEESIRAFLAERLSAFKVPRRIYYTDDFPKGPSGKIQRLKLVDRFQALKPEERKR
ncbi:AMP-dependent ligase [Spirochaetia bacterium]|nr:AMP-dependent ligase [Spirochaetia bacterium]